MLKIDYTWVFSGYIEFNSTIYYYFKGCIGIRILDTTHNALTITL